MQRGTLTSNDGWVYNGEFLNNMMHGNGKLIAPEGDTNIEFSKIEGVWIENCIIKIDKK